MLVLTLLACTAFTALGRWQWSRGEYRSAQWKLFEDAAVEPRAVTSGQFGTLERFTRVRVEGRFDGERQFLLDNITHDGRVGFYVITPLRLADGSALLVNRGFVPGTGYRDRLPDVSLPPEHAGSGAPVVLTGRMGVLPVAGVDSGRVPPPGAGPWPRMAAFPGEQDLAAVLPYPLQTGVLLLDPDTGPGFARDWRPPGIEPARHYSYAVQWWAFALLVLVLFVFANLEKKKSSNE